MGRREACVITWHGEALSSVGSGDHLLEDVGGPKLGKALIAGKLTDALSYELDLWFVSKAPFRVALPSGEFGVRDVSDGRDLQLRYDVVVACIIANPKAAVADLLVGGWEGTEADPAIAERLIERLLPRVERVLAHVVSSEPARKVVSQARDGIFARRLGEALELPESTRPVAVQSVSKIEITVLDAGIDRPAARIPTKPQLGSGPLMGVGQRASDVRGSATARDAARSWWVESGGRRQGPMSLQQAVLVAVAAGLTVNDTRVSTDGMDWVVASSVDAFKLEFERRTPAHQGGLPGVSRSLPGLTGGCLPGVSAQGLPGPAARQLPGMPNSQAQAAARQEHFSYSDGAVHLQSLTAVEVADRVRAAPLARHQVFCDGWDEWRDARVVEEIRTRIDAFPAAPATDFGPVESQ